MRSNAWTTLEEFDFLSNLIPQFMSQQEVRIIGPWLAATASNFFAKFPSRSAQFDRDRLTKKLRTWFGNHTRDLVKGTDARHVLDLSGRANRRPLPLQPCQAYSALYYRRGSPIYEEIKKLYELYKSEDPATLSSLQGLFNQSLDDDSNAAEPPSNLESHPEGTTAPPKPTRKRKKKSPTATPQPDAATTPQPDTAMNPQPDTATTPQPDDTIAVTAKPSRKKRKSKKPVASTDDAHYVPPFVHFQQTIIREKLKTMSDEEAEAVDRHIEDAYANSMKLWENPWLASTQADISEDEAKRKFYVKNAQRIGHSLQIGGEELTRQTSFRTFFLYGGPGVIPDHYDVEYSQTGKTVEGGLKFSTFLGPMYGELVTKFREWLVLTYSQDNQQSDIRTPQPFASVASTPQPSGTPELPSVVSTPRPSGTPEPPSVTSNPTPVGPTPLREAPSIAEPVPTTQPPSGPAISPSAVLPTSFTSPTTTASDPTPIDFDTSDTFPNTMDGLAATDSNITPANTVGESMTDSVITDSTTANPGVTTPTSTDLDGVTPTSVGNSDATNPPIVGSDTIDSSIISPAGPNVNDPATTGPIQSALNPAELSPGTVYPKFVTPEVLAHLSSITNVDGWSNLVQIYLKFETASPSKSNTHLPAAGRPPEVNKWLKDSTNVQVPIADTAAFVTAWAEWWSNCQPPDRVAGPFSRDPLSGTQWGRLLNGGKYGIFLFVMALSWWARSLDPTTSSPEFAKAVADTEWVLGQLTGALTAPLTPTPEAAPQTQVQDVRRPKRKVILTEKALSMGESVQKRYRR